MATSVPQVSHINAEALKQVLAKLIELAFEATKLSGDFTYLKEPVELSRRIYEEHFKLEANLGRWDRKYVNDIGKAIEHLEEVLQRRMGNARGDG